MLGSARCALRFVGAVSVFVALLVVLIGGVELVGAVRAVAAPIPGATVDGSFTCDFHGQESGHISGGGYPPGLRLNSSVSSAGNVIAADTSGSPADGSGNYLSRTLSWGMGGTIQVDLQISRADTGEVLATTQQSVTCSGTPAPSATGTASRDCATQTVSGTVAGRYLHPHYLYALFYGSTKLTMNYAGDGVTMQFPFTTNAIPPGLTSITLRLTDGNATQDLLVPVTLNSCPSVSGTTPAQGSATPTGSVRHCTASVPAGTCTSRTPATPATRTPTARASSGPSAAPSTAATTSTAAPPSSSGHRASPSTAATGEILAVGSGATSGASTAAGASTPVTAHRAHQSSLGWTVLLAVVLTLGAATVALAGAFIYQAQRSRP